MNHPLLNPADSLEVQRDKLLKISAALMQRVEQAPEDHGAGYAHFQRAVLLEEQVRARTQDLEKTLDLLNLSNTQLAEAKRSAERARADLSSAIETIQEGFALFDADERLVMCNSRFGQHMPDILRHIAPGLLFTGYVELVSRSSHLSLPPDDTPEDWVARRMDRHRDDTVVFNVRLIWDRWLQVSEHRTADGGTVIVHTDVTDMMRLERRERERMLDDQARIIRATLDHVNQGICIFDADRQLVGWNRRASTLLALPAGRLVFGMRFDRLLDLLAERLEFSGDRQADDLKAWVERTEPRPALSFEVARGNMMALDVFAEETPDKGFVISFTDVTAEREAIKAIVDANESLEARVMERTLALEAALAEAERANASKSRFVAAASHDLLQPLSAAKLFLSSIEDGDASPKQLSETLLRTRNALGSVETILGALLDISKLDAGLAALEPGPVPLDVVMRTLSDEFSPLAARRGLSLRIVPCSVMVQSDAAYLRRILQNLIGNAIRYTETGRIIVGARRQKDGVRVEVWDTGPGIPLDEQQSIFKEFHRVRATSGRTEGMGLGLAIVERACKLLQHPLALRSELGEGSCFTVDLPLASPVKVRARFGMDLAAPVGDDPLDGVIAMVIENDAELRRALTLQLERWRVSVLDVAGQEQAHDLLGELGISPDVLIADYHLDDGATGLGAIELLTREYGAIPAMIVTANRSADLRRGCKARGIELLYKPINPAQLHERITAMARVSRTRPAPTDPSRGRAA